MLIRQQHLDFDSHNRRQNEFRHVALTGKYSFSSPIPSMKCRVAVRAIYKLPKLNGGGRGVVWILMFSEVTLFEYNVSTIVADSRFKRKTGTKASSSSYFIKFLSSNRSL